MEANGQGEVADHDPGVRTLQRPTGTQSSLQPRCRARQELQWVFPILFILPFEISAAKKELELQVVHIYFDTSTFDRVEKDVKVILEDELFSTIS